MDMSFGNVCALEKNRYSVTAISEQKSLAPRSRHRHG
jgi:hypothetical protein